MSEITENTSPEILDTENAPDPDTVILHADHGLTLRQYIGPEDDKSYFRVQNENREHIARYGNKIFETIEEVEEARINPKGVFRLGVWKDDDLVGEVCIAEKEGDQAEMGIWIAENMTGRGYATSVMKTATQYALPRYSRVFAEVDPRNTSSIELLKRCGYLATGETVRRDWSELPIPVYEPAEHRS
jgi:RimJ/RimL family protein N-acetyltransferase